MNVIGLNGAELNGHAPDVNVTSTVNGYAYANAWAEARVLRRSPQTHLGYATAVTAPRKNTLSTWTPQDGQSPQVRSLQGVCVWSGLVASW